MEPGLCVNHQGGHDRPWFTYCRGRLRGLDTWWLPIPPAGAKGHHSFLGGRSLKGPGGARGLAVQVASQLSRKGTVTTQARLTGAGRLDGGRMERLSKKPSFVIFKYHGLCDANRIMFPVGGHLEMCLSE